MKKFYILYLLFRRPERASDEKRTSHNFKSNPGERRNMKNNYTVLYEYESSADYKGSPPSDYKGCCDYDYNYSSNYKYEGSNYSHNDNYKYSPPVDTGENFHHWGGPPSIEHNDSQLYNKNTCAPQPPLLPTTLPNMGISPNIVCAAPPQTPVTTALPVIPNVMFPPPANQV